MQRRSFRRIALPAFARPSLRLAAAIALLACSSCRAVDTRAWNLGQLHASDSHHHYSAALETQFEYFFRHVLMQPFAGKYATAIAKSPSEIADPSERCQEELRKLGELDASDPYTRARQIEWCSRLTVEDRSQLSRETAVYALAKAAQPLGTLLPATLPKERAPAGPEALSHLLSGLVSASKPLLGIGEWDATTKADFEASVALLASQDLDLAGARRALGVTCDLLERAGWNNGEAASLSKLVALLERTCVARAISLALNDDEPLVQAAAIEACERVGGRELLADLLLNATHIYLVNASRNRTSPVVLERICQRLCAGGLVHSTSKAGSLPPAQLVEEQLQALYHIALEGEESELRVAAMTTLSALSGSGITSLREEDWHMWWNTRTALAAQAGKGPP